MEIQLIRNATIKLKYAGKILLIDPMLCDKETFAPFAPGLKKNPTVDLKIPVQEIVQDIDALLVTHSHPDHFDELSSEILPKDTKVFCTPTDEEFIKERNFENSETVNESVQWQNITITRIEGQHGSGPVLPYMGKVSGFVLQAKNEQTIYVVSDSILTDNVKQAIEKYTPEVIITNSGGGIIPGFDNFPVHMNEEQTLLVSNLSPISTVIAVHLEAIDFCKTTRKSLRSFAEKMGVSDSKLLIPDDGEIINL
nr:MBL fold metallo-hydrolase [Allomuricauda sp.]|tara:strand:- start:244 stop:1002 length:759 start_codon:yes stop_codon:yes gene_type:complete